MRSVVPARPRCGALDGIPGLVYGQSSKPDGPVEELVDTGIQRLLGDLDELPHPVIGYSLARTAQSQGERSAASRLPADRVRKHCMISSIVLTVGCKFRCSYCPIPAYNQRQHRVKSGERIADEMGRSTSTYGISTSSAPTTTSSTTRPARSTSPSAGPQKVSAGERPFCKISLLHRSDRPRHDPHEGASAAHSPARADGGVDGRRRPDRHARQKRAKRKQDDRSVSPAARERHLSRSR